MNLEQLILHIEALIFASQQAITMAEIKEHLSNIIEEPIAEERLLQGIETIQEKYASEHYPFEIKAIGGGYQFLTKSDFYQTVAQLNGDKFIKKLSNAAMETLSIIAYKQPVTKSEIEFIRGVSADYSIQKLLEKELIIIAGRNEEAIGKPLIYATSKHFMDYLGINTPNELPKLKEIYNMEIVVPTDGAAAIPINEKSLVVDNEGQLKLF
ncbi:MAG TPA: SMC-Scp complex subunit ScpB [Edaphocola sp.]|nr:SMC-Scp complex subunit ScpB [Edaphocola sp.]